MINDYLPPVLLEYRDEIGEIEALTMPAAGIYRLTTSFYEDFYAVPRDYDGGILSPELFPYGEDRGRLFFFFEEKGRYILEYELARHYRSIAYLPEEIAFLDAVLADCSDGERIDSPGYFGPCPPPTVSPNGAVTRHKPLGNGFFLADSGGCWFLAVSPHLAIPEWPPIADYVETVPQTKEYFFIRERHFAAVKPALIKVFPELEHKI